LAERTISHHAKMAFPRRNNKPGPLPQSVTRLGHDLNRNDSAILERYGLRWIRDARRNVGIEKRVVKRITNNSEAMIAMAMEDHGAAEIPTVTERSVGIRVGRVRVIVVVVDPGLDRFPARDPGGFLVRNSPRQPDRILRHALANLTGFDQSLVVRRKGLENLRMIGDPRFGRGATVENKCAGAKADSQRPKKNLTLHVEKHRTLPLSSQSDGLDSIVTGP